MAAFPSGGAAGGGGLSLSALLPYLQSLLSKGGAAVQGMFNPVQQASVSAADQAAAANALNQTFPNSPTPYQPSDIAAVGPPGGAPPADSSGSTSAATNLMGYQVASNALRQMQQGDAKPRASSFSFGGSAVNPNPAGLPGAKPAVSPQSVGQFLLTPAGQQLMQRLQALGSQGGF